MNGINDHDGCPDTKVEFTEAPVGSREYLVTQLAAYWEAAIAPQWDAIRDAQCDFYYVTVRRAALKKLRDAGIEVGVIAQVADEHQPVLEDLLIRVGLEPEVGDLDGQPLVKPELVGQDEREPPGAQGEGRGDLPAGEEPARGQVPRPAEPADERRRDAPSHRDSTGEAVDSPDQLSRRPQLGVRQGHGVGDTDHAPPGGECGLENVGVGKVAPPHVRLDLGLVALNDWKLTAQDRDQLRHEPGLLA